MATTSRIHVNGLLESVPGGWGLKWMDELKWIRPRLDAPPRPAQPLPVPAPHPSTKQADHAPSHPPSTPPVRGKPVPTRPQAASTQPATSSRQAPPYSNLPDKYHCGSTLTWFWGRYHNPRRNAQPDPPLACRSHPVFW